VIRAIALLKNSLYKIKLLIVGGESDEADMSMCAELGHLHQIVKEEGIGDMVKFAGRKNRDLLKYYYSAADIFVTTPWYEPFGITTVESMACGTPVLGANVGGIKYSVKDNETGFLIPPNDPDALAEKIRLLLSKPSILYRMKMNALERVNSLFTWSIVSSTIAEMYESVLSSCRTNMTPIVPASQLAPVITLDKDKTRIRKLTS
jgi:glycosyltransferase involved in cell wall biosynthesis